MFNYIIAAGAPEKFDFTIFYTLAVILVATKVLGILMRKLGLPQVVGAILAGLLLGPFTWGGLGWSPLETSPALKVLAEIGVVMIMFSAGLDTNIKEIKRNGKASLIITALGVLVPLGLGYVVAGLFFGFGPEHTIKNIFVGVILTATSVGITVEVLKEMGKLKGKVGVSVLSAAILDDIIGIVILTIVIGIAEGGVNGVNYGELFLKVFGFFVFAIAVGVMCHYVFKWAGKKYPNKRRVPILSLAICFAFAAIAELVFGIADITGAYMAGIMLSNMQETNYVEKKIDINSYMIFSPVFFCNIGLSASLEGFDWGAFGFAVTFVIVGLLAKFIGCGAGAKICKYSWKESAQVGLGMMARGEVCLLVVYKGLEKQIVEPEIGQELLIAAILLVVVSSLMTPILLKLAFKNKKNAPLPADVGPLPAEQENLVVPSASTSDVEGPLDMQASALDELEPDDLAMSQHDTIHDALMNNDEMPADVEDRRGE